jgi:hypothetical protein
MQTDTQYATASELRYILNVMEERTHLGLDNESANRIKTVLGRRIADAENTSARKSTSFVRITVEEPELLV